MKGLWEGGSTEEEAEVLMGSQDCQQLAVETQLSYEWAQLQGNREWAAWLDQKQRFPSPHGSFYVQS